ncbi:hypothetical protein V1T75_02485 [Tenacibaculum sp. FZY0031]|uniref:hypothetical protein n=1 Tax=Tenacibaculum sp. FZY0031 TaxID=3116648 RepID=UPI002EA200FD|nr:hypothetical protein [Tenacibaculum sp. FZY0031]
MEILVIIYLFLFLGVGIFLLYKILKWVVTKKVRVLGALSILLIAIISIAIYQLFIVKMEFIQSEIYSDLYLVKKPTENKNALNKSIKNFVNQKLAETKNIDTNYSLRFYEYTKNWNLLVFGDYGTAYFIENEEDLGGFSVEDLNMYQKEKLAILQIYSYKKDSTQHYGILEYYEKGYPVKTDTLTLQKK